MSRAMTTGMTRRSMLRGLSLASAAAVAAPLALDTAATNAEAAGLGTSGTAVAVGNVNMRAGAGTGYRVVRVVRSGQHVSLNGRAVGKWQPVRIGSQRGYISSRYLRRAGSKVTSSVGSTSVSGLGAASYFSGPSGVTSRGYSISAEVHSQFPQIASIGGRRAETGSDHNTGHAIDVMLPGNYRGAAQQALGYQIAEYMRAHASRLGITYIIWHQHIWNIARAGEGWRAMGDRGSDNANHMNHVHISYR